VAALIRQRQTGEGALIDMAQAEATAYTLGVSYLETELSDADPEPKGNQHATAAPHGCFRCRGEERWCVLSVETDDQWHRFCNIMGNEELADQPRFLTAALRLRNKDELHRLVEQWTVTQTPEDIMHALQEQRIPAGVVQNGADLVNDPQLRQRDYFQKYDDSPIGPFEVPRGGVVFKDMPDGAVPLTPPLGAHTDEIMRDVLGYDEATIQQWKEEGILS
jgi:benzylsuccinate CoA-transferase BbsF subunit